MPQNAEDFLKQFQGPESASSGQVTNAPPQQPSADEFLSSYAAPQAAGGAPAPTQVVQQSGPMRYVNELGSDLASGTTGLVGLPGTLTSLAEKYAAAAGVPKAAIPFLWPMTHGLPTVQGINDKLNKVGGALGIGPIVDRPDLAPQNAAERYGGAAVKALPAAAATILTGGAATPALLSSIGGAAAGEGAKDLGFGWKGQLAANLIGGGVGGALGTAATAPTVEKVAASLGKSTTMQEAGEHLQDAARDWLNNVKPAKEAAVWDPVNELLGPAPTPMTETGKVLDSITESGGPLSGLMATLRPKLPEALQKQFDNVFGGTPLPASKVTGTGTWADYMKRVMPQQPSWEDVKELRSALGSYMGRPDMMKDLGAENAQRIYGALTEDMRNVADAHGYAELFDNANAQSVALNDIAEGPMKLIVADGKPSLRNDPAPGAAAKAVLRGAQDDGTTLQVLRQNIPGAVDELAAAHLRMQSPKYIKLNPQGSAPVALSPEAHAALIPDLATRALIQHVVPPPGKPQSSVLDHAVALNSALGAAIAEHVLFNGGVAPGVGAALLGAGLPKGLQLLKSAGAMPGIVPGALQGVAASPSTILGITQPDTSTAR